MTQTAHTPGPWIFSSSTGRIGRDPFSGDFIATVRVSEEANAHLIAAAPDLLATLKAARQWLDLEGGYDLQGIDAVIAKATGAS